MPVFGHLPSVLGEGNKKLSKRDPESNLFLHRDHGFTPEGLLNYLALLGWSIGPDRDIFTMAEMTAAFDVADVNPNPARFDLKKAEAINSAHVRLLAPDDFRDRLVPVPAPRGPRARRLVRGPRRAEHRALLDAGAPLIQERITLLGEAVGMLGFLFVADDALEIADDARGALREESAGRPRRRGRRAGRASTTSRPTATQEALQAALVDGASASSRGSRSRRCGWR